MATTHVSSSTITSSLRGIKLPAKREDLKNRAKESGADEAVQKILERFPDREYRSAADIAKGIKEATKSIKDAMPHSSASEVLKSIKGVKFPASRTDIIEAAKRNNSSPDVQKTIAGLQPETYESVNAVAKALSTARS